MPSFNKVMLIGNLTRDPQVKQLQNQMVVAEFGIAMNRKYRTAAGEDKEEVCFVDCSAFGKQAETIAQWCRKGKQLFVEGRLKFDTWDDRAGGGKRSKLSVVVENFQFLGSRDDHLNGNEPFGGTGGASGGPPGRPHPGSQPAATTPNMFEEKEKGDQKGDRGDREDRADRPEKRPQRAGRAGAKQSAEQPFGEEKMFQEADIPF